MSTNNTLIPEKHDKSNLPFELELMILETMIDEILNYLGTIPGEWFA